MPKTEATFGRQTQNLLIYFCTGSMEMYLDTDEPGLYYCLMGKYGSEYGNGSRGHDFRVGGGGNVLMSLSVSPEGPVTPPGRQVDPEALLAEIKNIAALGGRTGNKGQPRVYRK